MINCRHCKEEIKQTFGGRAKVYCNEKCRHAWRKSEGKLATKKPAALPEGASLPPLKELKTEFSYDPETGVITRLKTRGRFKAGEAAGCINSMGYVQILYKGRSLKAHRLGWYLHTGQDPQDLFIDHINRKRSDNRFCNLRLATNSENNLNRINNIKSSTGHTGIYFNKSRKAYYVQISIEGKNAHLGYTESIEEAIALRQSAMAKHQNTEFLPE
jgi:hypothetical protein